MKWPIRRQILLVLVFVIGLIVIYDYRRQNSNVGRHRKVHKNQKGCKLPHTDPYDPSILSYLKTPPPLQCEGLQYEYTYLTDDELLHLNKTAFEQVGLSLACYYRCFDRVDGDDFSLKFEQWKEIVEPTKPGCEFIETYCQRTSFPKTTVYYNNHNQVLENTTKSASRAPSTKKDVIIVLFDSVSHSTFIRSLPKSLEVLKSKYKSYIFDGFSKVGDNSFPNGVAFLAGKNGYTEFGDVRGYFDDHPIIWKDFRRAGYKTYYAEDYTDFNIFSYLAKGFRHKPVDCYLRPFWLNIYGSYLHRRSKYLCYGNHAMHNLELNYLSQFLKKNKDPPKFALNWFTEISHDYLNTVNVADDDFADFLKRHYEDLKESFVFVISDHGHRFDPIRQTAIGRIEERFPFFSMHIPESLRRTLPELDGVIQRNTEVLTAFWDFYVTMREIIDLGVANKWSQLNAPPTKNPRNHNYSKRGQSLLRPIKDRNCEEAGITEDFCMCYPEVAVSIRSPLIKRFGRELISHLNQLLTPYKQCATLKITKILHATKIEDELSEEEEKYRVSVEAAPSSGVFEAVLKYNEKTNHAAVYGNVNRVNSYGNQSICVKVAEMRKFCYCTPNAN
ncbi:hypothetical protein OESDEN_07150 [Oesophagostomum dentatum]|uniref:Uncharacterized protein n=1 Tax=Oesophagostomum dentatum TaxID=61180 RepID=A0A0B1T6S7_OESDE|nr:hypothetical protein OESDEN_07150 [Oesophagostomum dentatum]